MRPPGDGEGGRLELRGVRKAFGGVPVLQGVDLDVGGGELVSLLGPSGCGKTTTLNVVAGFVAPDEGDVRIGGRSMTAVPAHRRDLGMVFQSHALFPHMTVAENVGFGLRMRSVPGPESARRIAEALELVRLNGFDRRYPRELSGGQQQRVGLARALTVRPRVLLLDEPLSSLDAKLRREMQLELRGIQRFVNLTALYVTHDQEEALALSDRIVLMNQGRVEQAGTPEDVYTRPTNEFVAGFIGEANFFEATVLETIGTAARVELAGGETVLVEGGRRLDVGHRLRLAVRPDRVRLAAPGAGPAATGEILGTLASRVFLGSVVRCVVTLAGERCVQAEVPAGEPFPFAVGGRVALTIRSSDWLVVGTGRSVA